MSNFHSANLPFLEQLHTDYQESPEQLDASWKQLFAMLEQTPESTLKPLPLRPSETTLDSGLRVYHLIQAYRTYGHLMATVNPIATHRNAEPHQLRLKNLDFCPEELSQLFPTCHLLDQERAPLETIIETLKKIYCDKIGIEYMSTLNPKLEQWIQQRIEPTLSQAALSIDQKRMILQHLNKSELFEVFLHTKYTGQKRFSIEGGETLIPMLSAILETGALGGLHTFVIGMTHRGRLNVLSNILQKSYADIFSEFESSYIPESYEGSGDVKYHKGFSSEVTLSLGGKARVFLTPNPSHLEAVNPIVEGQARAHQVLCHDRKDQVLPILIHGDAAIAGQGIVYETMQLHNLEGYSTGGTIHLVINNQIGFTTLPKEGRSTHYCTDIAHTFHAPIFHVNAEDPESCIYAVNLAVQLRQTFHCDVFIDINCYRKYGHNETDEPAFTQPLEYQLIRQKKSIRELYRDHLIMQGVVERKMAEALEEEFKQALNYELDKIKIPHKEKHFTTVQEFQKIEQQLLKTYPTGVNQAVLQTITQRLSEIPEGFSLHKKLKRLVSERQEMVMAAKPFDWGMGETLAYASLLWEGHPVRLTGQDSARGTFSHRHAVWMDQVFDRAYTPLAHLKESSRFDVINTPLSEYAPLGFEFGYSSVLLDTLVIWEAQFGDFSNGAQVVIDQFIATAEQKWSQKSALVLLLPHGYEGQGPEHSSARIERFLSLCGNDNMLVTYPTTPAQLFHLLRRQVIAPFCKPLVVFTPKGLLRHPQCTSALSAFEQGSFETILDDPEKPLQAKRLLLCSGRIYYDLISSRTPNEVIIRIEQLYPLHKEKLTNILSQYPHLKQVHWVQEEPKNMGAWSFIQLQLAQILTNFPLIYTGRERSASTATGSFALHQKQLQSLIDTLFKKA